ncbi:MAG: MFS transporter [Acidimicrobiales bacterium]
MPSSTLLSPRPGAITPGTEPAGLGGRRPSTFLIVILAAQLMVVLDTTIVNVALPHIQQGLGFSAGGLSWVLNAYILTFGGLLLLGARAGDLLGRRRVFLTGIALFSVSSLLGGVATAGWMLLAARALQGVGGALAAPSALALLTTAYPEGPERVRAIGLYTTVSAAGGATGLVAGGVLTELVSWRWVMFVNVPIGLAVLFLGRRVLAETPRRHGRFDVKGALTSTAGMGGLVLGLVEAGTWGWSSPRTVVPILLGAALLAAFVRAERRAGEPIVPLRLLTNSTRAAANGARALVYAGMYGMFFFLSQFLQDAQGYSPLRAGIAFLPMPAAVFLSSQLVSRVLLRRLPQRTVMVGGIALSAAGLLLATQIHPGATYGQVVVSMVMIGVGTGTSFITLTSASLHEVAPHDAGAASGLINVSQQLGAALGLAVLVSIFGAVSGHASLAGGAATGARLATLVHGLDTVFAVAALFTVAALGLVTWQIGTVRTEPATLDFDLDELEQAA